MFFNNKCCKGQMFEQNNCCQEPCRAECPCDPVIEPVIERCVTRDICHTVEQE